MTLNVLRSDNERGDKEMMKLIRYGGASFLGDLAMIDQYFGVKELYEVVLKAKGPMQFGSRRLEEGEPVLYFENVNISMLSERSSPIMARGGWSNMPRVIWEDRSEVVFSLTEGIMSSISMSILLSANMTEKKRKKFLFTNMNAMSGRKKYMVKFWR